jgi:hypothetical protein
VRRSPQSMSVLMIFRPRREAEEAAWRQAWWWWRRRCQARMGQPRLTRSRDEATWEPAVASGGHLAGLSDAQVCALLSWTRCCIWRPPRLSLRRVGLRPALVTPRIRSAGVPAMDIKLAEQFLTSDFVIPFGDTWRREDRDTGLPEGVCCAYVSLSFVAFF